MQEDEHDGDRWFKEAAQQAKVVETIQVMKAGTRAQGHTGPSPKFHPPDLAAIRDPGLAARRR